MFLDITYKRNPNLIKTAFQIHQEGKIYPNTYVLDIDAIKHNARIIKKEADKYDLNLYMMTKQIGRNPEIAKKISECGIDKVVAVDPWEAITLGKAGLKLGNVGHLVQIPTHMIREILLLKPEVITVFTVEKAAEISKEAEKLGIIQDIMMKVIDDNDLVYEGQEGGFKLNLLSESVKKINEFRNVRIVGITAFPCFLYNEETGDIEKTKNVDTLLKGAKIIEENFEIQLKQLNFPSANSTFSMKLIKENGGNYGEPGHAFTGTTPIHANRLVGEIPAMVYVSEVSHCYENKAYVYGGGFYRRSNVKKAMVGKNFEEGRNNILRAEKIHPEYIDYYGTLLIDDKKAHVGDTVIYAFRTQIFVTRSQVALVEGIQEGNIRLMGIYDNLGKRIK
jgi:predicted amino acid racemase